MVVDSTVPQRVRNKGLTTQKTWIRPAFAQFSRSRVEISKKRRGLHEKGRVWVDDSTVPQKLEFDLHSHSSQKATLKLHSYVSHFPGQVVERLTILPYPRSGQKWRVNHSKNVNATCICTVFNIQIWNFTGMSMGLKILSYPQRGQE